MFITLAASTKFTFHISPHLLRCLLHIVTITVCITRWVLLILRWPPIKQNCSHIAKVPVVRGGVSAVRSTRGFLLVVPRGPVPGELVGRRVSGGRPPGQGPVHVATAVAVVRRRVATVRPSALVHVPAVRGTWENRGLRPIHRRLRSIEAGGGLSASRPVLIMVKCCPVIPIVISHTPVHGRMISLPPACLLIVGSIRHFPDMRGRIPAAPLPTI